MDLKLVATDLDGTLLRSDGTVSPRTRAALARAVQAGVNLVVVTARPSRYMDPIADALDLDGVAICANGAVVYDLATRRALMTRPLDEATARRAAAALTSTCAGIGFAVETGTRVVYEPAFTRPDTGDIRLAVASLDDQWRLGVPVLKLLAWTGAVATDDVLPKATAALDGIAEVTHSGGPGLLEVSAAGVTKASALAELCRQRGIDPAEVAAFGDMPNDLDMLAWAGLSYAVANAHPDVLVTAAGRTASNNDDGVALVLEHLLSDG